MIVDLSRCRLTPFKHQIEGVQALVDHPYFGLFDEMGMTKSAQTIIAAQILYERGVIDRVLVVAPASVRGVWFDADLGELAKHLWHDVPAIIKEYHAKVRTWYWPEDNKKGLVWTVTNYEFIRSKLRRKKLLLYCTPKTLLILDESAYVRNHKAAQTKACFELRKKCGRVVLLNGTPIAHSPLDMFAQGNLMHPSILDCKYITYFKARYAIEEALLGRNGKAILDPRGKPIMVPIAYQNLGDLQDRFKPYVLRRLKKDCLDLPIAMPPVALHVALSDPTWAMYKEMRDEMVVWLKDGRVATAAQAAVKAIRLAQITSGFLGGIEEIYENDNDDELASPLQRLRAPLQEISKEKQDFVLGWHREQLIADPSLKLIVFVRFRPELDRLAKTVEEERLVTLGQIHGGQKRADRDAALRLLDPRTAPEGPVFFAGTYGTGALGLNLTACHVVVYMSYDYSLYKYLQSMARVDRPGQTHAVSYYDIIATGPNGQKTLDHAIVKARREREDVANWTISAWVKALEDE